MFLAAGSRLGPYEIVSILGTGGMGEVYRAHDTKLNRDVAIKALPASLPFDVGRLARFRLEAQLLAALNHPNVAAIYGFEESSGTQALVLELVEGPTLAGRIARGPIGLDEALPIAKQIAEALEAAHEQGVVHRDLKPANIKLRPDGLVKVLDFGLAKALDPSMVDALSSHVPEGIGTATPSGFSADVTDSPTLSVLGTHDGTILGTPAYMAPEQVKGKSVDRRADIWAFGLVLFEMLTGRRAFAGDTPSETFAQIIERDVNLETLPPSTPPAIVSLVRRCLTKEARSRLQAIGEARLVIEQLSELTIGAASQRPAEISPREPSFFRAWPWVIAVVGATILLLIAWRPWRAPRLARPTYLTTQLGIDTKAVLGLGTSAVLSPDGNVVAFVGLPKEAETADAIRIYLRPLDALQAVPIPGTEHGRAPFFSPDGRWIGFFADAKLKTVSINGGPVVTLADAPRPRGGTWAEDGTIVFAPGGGAGLARVSSAGGRQPTITSLVAGDVVAAWPQMLPGDRAVLYTQYGRPSTEDNAALVVQPLSSAVPKIIQRGGYFGRYVASGHLIYVRSGTLFAMPFDLNRFQATGPAVPVVDRLQGVLPGGAEYSVSPTGTLLYYSAAINLQALPISWMDRTGKTSVLRPAAVNWLNAVFAPDGRRLAFQVPDHGQMDLWTYELERDGLTRLTVDGAGNAKPVWAPDGRAIAFASLRGGGSTSSLYWMRTDGTGDINRLTDSKANQRPTSWHPSGKFLAFDEDSSSPAAMRPWFSPDQSPGTANIMILPLDGDGAFGWKPGKPITFLSNRFNESEAMFSPDGRWIAYMSNETGRSEIYVRPFPGPGPKWLISSGGGAWPMWSRIRTELFFVNDDIRLMVASYMTEGGVFRADKPQLYSDVRVSPRGLGRRPFGLHPDGKRVVVNTDAPRPSQAGDQAETRSQSYVFVFNFFDQLRQVAPPRP